MFLKNVLLQMSQNSHENTRAAVSLFNTVVGLRKIEAQVQLFSCEFCDTFKNTHFVEHLRTNASVHRQNRQNECVGRNRQAIMNSAFREQFFKNEFASCA